MCEGLRGLMDYHQNGDESTIPNNEGHRAFEILRAISLLYHVLGVREIIILLNVIGRSPQSNAAIVVMIKSPATGNALHGM
jgi:hypothetical protein